MIRQVTLACTVAVLCGSTLLADFHYQQSTKITGGAMAGMMKVAGAFSKQAREPIVSDVYVKGNRMAHVNAHSAQIIDLDKETITDLNFDKKQYSVMTFAQMKQAIEDAIAKAKDQKAEGAEHADVSFKASVKDTGITKELSGLKAKDFIVTLMMEGTDQKTGQTGSFSMTNDVWMAPEIKGYQEVRDFQIRYAQKLGVVLGSSGFNPMAMGRPDMVKAMSDMAKEMSKMKGVPVMTVSRMGSTSDGTPLPAASVAPEAAQSQGPDVKEAAQKSAGNAAMDAALGRLGGFGGLGRKKKQQDEPQQQAPSGDKQAKPAGPAILMESTTETSGFSSAPVEAATFEVPAGFKEVDPAMSRRRGR